MLVELVEPCEAQLAPHEPPAARRDLNAAAVTRRVDYRPSADRFTDQRELRRRAAHPRRHPRPRQPPPRTSPPSRSRSPTAPPSCSKDEVDMFEGMASQGQGPAQVAARRRRRAARARPGRGAGRGDGQRDQLQHRVDLDLRAGVDVRVPRALRPALPAGQAARPALPRGRLRPGRRRAADRPGVHTLEARRPGRRALPLGRARGPRRPQRHDARPRAADLGLRDQLRRARRRRAGQGQPADAQARAPHLGGGRLPRPGQLHGLPPAGLQERRRHEAGRQRADLGRLRRPGRLRDAVRPQRRRHAGLRGLQRRQGGDLPLDGRRADHQPHRGGLPVLEGRAHPGPQGVEAASAPRSASSPAARTSTSSSSTPAGRPSAPRSSSPARAARSPPAPPPAATCTSTTTATCG